MLLTPEIFLDYLECKYKAYCKLQGKQENKSDYEILQTELDDEYKKRAITYLQQANEILINYSFQDTDVLWNFPLLEKHAFSYLPIHFCENNKLTQKDKLLLVASCFVLRKMQSSIPTYGKIIYGEEFRLSNISTDAYLGQVEKIFEAIKTFEHTKPEFAVADYCRSCDFCKVRAQETDDLSLLRGMRSKDIAKQHKKGIFTVTQYSYTFRQKKKRKRVRHYKNSYLFELKALAVREKKIFIAEKSELPFADVQIYFDIEGNEENNFHYLIGLVIVVNGKETIHSLWANSKDEEEMIFQQFLSICQRYEHATLFHYASYETTYLKKCKKKFPQRYDNDIDALLQRTVNILTIIYSSIYFPTYSNELKDIAQYLGFSWTETHASGIQSIVWRTRWEMTKNNLWKEKLLQYNLEDCFALQRITDFISTISTQEAFENQYPNFHISWTKDIQDERNYRLGKPQFFFPELAYINKCAYFDYQRQKIFIRTNKALQRHYKQKVKKIQKDKVHTHIAINPARSCPLCGNKRLYKKGTYSKLVYDLKFFSGGVKKWIMQYTAVSMQCKTCGKEFLPKRYKQIQQKYGHNLISWVIYNIIANGISLERISKNFSDIFGLSLTSSTLYSFKTYAAAYYQFTYRKMYHNLMKGTMLHADETKVNLKTTYGYVWVFTNMEEVIFLYKNSREGTFLQDFLKKFAGVLITDYYAAYEFLDIPQQKCLIHLIRDLNHDIFQNPFDEELKELVQQFATVLRSIINTVDRFGLKKRYLRKHKKDVDTFFQVVINKTYASEVAESYKKRFEKNKDTLFMFLAYDGVPWNNNNAEHALKHFATYRKKGNGIFTKSGIEDYLVLLSIYQTCRYKNINFLQFLLSKKKIIHS